MEDRVAVSVVVPTIGRSRLLRACLGSIFACDTHPDEVLVVDQSGNAAAEQVVEEYSALGVTLLQCRPAGIARAMNLALATARHPWLLVTHDDCTVDRSWIRAGAALVAAAPAATIITGRVLPAGDPTMVPSTKTDVEPHDYTGDPRWDVLYANNMILPVASVAEIGGFDELFQAAAEDNDLCYRWLKTGHRLEYRPELTVFHHDWRTPQQLDALYARYWYGTGQFYAKHLHLGDLRMLRSLSWDLIGFGRACISEWLRGERTGTPYAQAMLQGLPAGMREGWRDVGRSRRP
jgi:GT2 family glycosyltransferase